MSIPRRKRLLFLCQTLPYPPTGGVEIRSYHVLRLLASAFDVTGLCFYRWKSGWARDRLSENLEALRKLAPMDAFPIPHEHSRARMLWDHLRSTARSRVYTFFEYQSRDFLARLIELLRSDDFDLVHVDSLDLSAYLPLLNDRPVICVHHNVESALLARRATFETSGWRRGYVGRQAELMEREERRWCGRVALNVTVSEADRERLEDMVPAGKYTVVPNGVDTTAFVPSGTAVDGIVFVGGTKSFANRDALQFFCSDVLPCLRGRGKKDSVQWVGRCTDEEQRAFGREYGVELTGYVDDIRPYVHRAACYAVPLRVGGGTRLEILDAWAMGKGVVSTSVGCEGLAVEDGENILIRDDPEEFAAAVAAVLDDPGLRQRLGDGARATAERIYSWEVIGMSMIETYSKVSGGGSAGS
jgi:glycosyltransferase involved in cell wall biosynthesis